MKKRSIIFLFIGFLYAGFIASSNAIEPNHVAKKRRLTISAVQPVLPPCEFNFKKLFDELTQVSQQMNQPVPDKEELLPLLKETNTFFPPQILNHAAKENYFFDLINKNRIGEASLLGVELYGESWDTFFKALTTRVLDTNVSYEQVEFAKILIKALLVEACKKSATVTEAFFKALKKHNLQVNRFGQKYVQQLEGEIEKMGREGYVLYASKMLPRDEVLCFTRELLMGKNIVTIPDRLWLPILTKLTALGSTEAINKFITALIGKNGEQWDAFVEKLLHSEGNLKACTFLQDFMMSVQKKQVVALLNAPLCIAQSPHGTLDFKKKVISFLLKLKEEIWWSVDEERSIESYVRDRLNVLYKDPVCLIDDFNTQGFSVSAAFFYKAGHPKNSKLEIKRAEIIKLWNKKKTLLEPIKSFWGALTGAGRCVLIFSLIKDGYYDVCKALLERVYQLEKQQGWIWFKKESFGAIVNYFVAQDEVAVIKELSTWWYDQLHVQNFWESIALNAPQGGAVRAYLENLMD